jgi:lipopolysaccharide export system permease protein
MIKIIDRYIFKELIDPFLFGLTSFTLILSASMVMFELVRAVVVHGMPLLVAAQIFIFRLPGIMVYIFPMATLLAALLGFSRLSHDSEIIAMKASGISLYRIMIPVMFLGLIISLTTMAFYEIVVPQANMAAKNLLVTTSVKSPPKLQKNVFVPEFERGKLKRIFYARELKGDIMNDVIVQEFDNGQLRQIVNAKEGKWQTTDSQWRFMNGIIYIIAEDGEYKNIIHFEEEQSTIKYSPSDFRTGDKKPEEMNIAELNDYIKLKEKMGIDMTENKIQLNLKIAIPFACLVFVLLGAPLGLSPRRSSSSIGLGISILLVFGYYVLMFISMAMGQLGVFPPVIAAWVPNLITGGAGWYILDKVAKT